MYNNVCVIQICAAGTAGGQTSDDEGFAQVTIGRYGNVQHQTDQAIMPTYLRRVRVMKVFPTSKPGSIGTLKARIEPQRAKIVVWVSAPDSKTASEHVLSLLYCEPGRRLVTRLRLDS